MTVRARAVVVALATPSADRARTSQLPEALDRPTFVDKCRVEDVVECPISGGEERKGEDG